MVLLRESLLSKLESERLELHLIGVNADVQVWLDLGKAFILAT